MQDYDHLSQVHAIDSSFVLLASIVLTSIPRICFTRVYFADEYEMSTSEGFFDFPTASPDAFEADDANEERSMTFGMLGILVFLDTCFIANYYVVKSLRQCTDAESATLRVEKDLGSEAALKEISGFAASMEKFVCGLLLGKIKAMPLSIQKFPGWRPIKYKAHIFLTGFFVLVSLVMLNPAAFVPKGVDVGGLTLKGELCKPFDRQAGLDELRAEVMEITNYAIAVKQWSHMFRMQKALVNDTSRYGMARDTIHADHTCVTIPASGGVREVPGNKNQWADITAYPAAEFGSFFPGYCNSAREAAKLAALSITCVDEKCACPRIPSTGFTRFLGIDGDELCWLRICISSPLACPAHTNDDMINPDNYNEAQLNVTDVGEPTIETGRPKLSDEVKERGRTGILLLLYQVDVASNIYSIYVLVALFFPSPLRVIRLPYWIAIKRFLFGAEQRKFIIIFVSSLWIYKYLTEYLRDPDFVIILNNFLRGDPCYLDGKYVYERFAIIDEICDKLVPLQPSFETKAKSIPPVLQMINDFANAKCNTCKFPMHYLYPFRTDLFPRSQVGPLGFTKESPAHMCERRGEQCRVLFPADDIVFFGNRTICLDSEFARSRAIVKPDTEFTFRSMSKMWINSGLLASFLVKIAMTNFAMGLLHLADPFLSCAGEFMWIPEKLGSGLGSRDKNEVFRGFTKNKLKTLRNTHLRTCIIWGTIMHVCVFNLVKTAFVTSKQLYGGLLLGNQDRAILTITGIGSVLIIVMAWCWRRVLARKTLAFKGK